VKPWDINTTINRGEEEGGRGLVHLGAEILQDTSCRPTVD
jgi:hypothetical protein